MDLKQKPLECLLEASWKPLEASGSLCKPREASGSLWEPLAASGSFWEPLGASGSLCLQSVFSALGASLGRPGNGPGVPLGAFLLSPGMCNGLLEPSLGASWAVLGPSGSILEPSWGAARDSSFKAPKMPLGCLETWATYSSLETQCTHFGGLLGSFFGNFWGHFLVIFGIIFWTTLWSLFGPLLGAILGLMALV